MGRIVKMKRSKTKQYNLRDPVKIKMQDSLFKNIKYFRIMRAEHSPKNRALESVEPPVTVQEAHPKASPANTLPSRLNSASNPALN